MNIQSIDRFQRNIIAERDALKSQENLRYGATPRRVALDGFVFDDQFKRSIRSAADHNHLETIMKGFVGRMVEKARDGLLPETQQKYTHWVTDDVYREVLNICSELCDKIDPALKSKFSL